MSEIVKSEKPTVSLVATMANRYGLAPERFMDTIKATVFPQDKQVSNEQAAAFLAVANQYELNPFTKEIYAFPHRNGGIVPIVSVDGWATLINRQHQLDGVEFTDHLDDGELNAITCSIYRKDRSKPTQVTEYMEECKRNTDPWTKYPARMLRHKAFIQCARYAFGLSGIYDEDEAERIQENGLNQAPPKSILPPAISEEAGKKLEAFHNAAEKKGLNNAQRHMLLGKHSGDNKVIDVEAATKELESLPVAVAVVTPPAETPTPVKAKGRKKVASIPDEPPTAPEPKPAEAPKQDVLDKWF